MVEQFLLYPLEWIVSMFLVVFIAVILPNLAYLLFGWILVRFDRTRDLGVKFFAMSMLAPRLTAMHCRRHCESTPCRNWTCENYCHSNIDNK